MSGEIFNTIRDRSQRCALAWSLCSTLAPALALAQARTFTTSADFASGIALHVDTRTPDQLQLEARTQDISVVWIPASGRGTVLRIDPATGAIVGEYRTAPLGRGHDPSRTAVDGAGNAWLGNRNEMDAGQGSVVQVGLLTGGTRVRRDADGSTVPDALGGYVAPPFDHCTCIDRDGDGLIRTSRGRADILAWPDVHDGAADGDAMVQDAEDECIRLYQRTSAPRAHQISIAPSGDVWVGSFPGAVFDRLDGTSGAILETVTLPGGGYGGIVDSRGILWSSGFDRNMLVRWDPTTQSGTTMPVLWSFGVVEDRQGHIWNTMWTNNTTAKFDGHGALLPGYPRATFGGSAAGVAVTADGDIWVAHATTNTVNRLTADGALRKRITVGQSPQGLAVDGDDKLWVVNRSSNSVQRIDPQAGTDGLGAVERTVALGSGASPQAYSGMAAAHTVHTLASSGTWTVTCDGERAATNWSKVSWTGDEPVGTSIAVAVRAADSEIELEARAWLPVKSGAVLAPGAASGRFLQIQAVFARDAAAAASPVLFDLTVNDNRAPDVANAHASVSQLWPPDHRVVPIEIQGVTDPDGDAVTCKVTAITQDEPVSGRRNGPTAPDAGGVGTTTAWVRAERVASDQANGRVYVIHFTAADGRGGATTGRVQVCVPHDDRDAGCTDDGQSFDATTGPMLDAWQFPNPFNPSTTIAYILPADARVRLTIYDALGRVVRELVDTPQPAGEWTAVWDGRDVAGRPVASGVYIYRLHAGEARQHGRMLLIK